MPQMIFKVVSFETSHDNALEIHHGYPNFCEIAPLTYKNETFLREITIKWKL